LVGVPGEAPARMAGYLSLASAASGLLPEFAALPLPLSNVSLLGTWARREVANREVLLSINETRWLCHFTTAANLTKCEPDSAAWQTYVKDASSSKYTHKAGFLASGDDVKPSETTSFDECEAFCTSTSACLGITFQSDDVTPAAPIKCYWKSVISFTPATTNCIAPGGSGQPVCTPLPGEMGLGGYYGHYQGHWLSATAFLVNSSGNATVRASANRLISGLGKVMDAWRAAYGDDWGDGYLFPYSFPPWEKLLDAQGAGPYYSVPFYTLHKIMAGLLDQAMLAGSELAYELVTRMASWVHRRVEATIAKGGMKLWQQVLEVEWGGMNDVLMHLYAVSGDETHLATARRFNAFVFTAPLSVGHDDLAELPFPHANFHLPEIIGNARGYELTGNATDRSVVQAFYDALLENHTYATGGSNAGECWQAPRDLGNFLSTQTEESCTQYNVLKIARHMFTWSAEPALADFYERAIENGIVGNQRLDDAGSLMASCGTPAGCDKAGCRGQGPTRAASPATTSYIYMLPLGGATHKPWGKSDYGFPCCWGTLSESFAKLGDSIYFVAPTADALFVNLYASSEVRVGLRDDHTGYGTLLTLEQTAYEYANPNRTARFVVRDLTHAGTSSTTSKFAIKLRVPGWLPTGAGTVQLNGVAYPEKVQPGAFLTIERTWVAGDALDVHFPPALWVAPLNDHHAWHNATVAFMFGPLVLVGVNVTSDLFVPASATFRTDPTSFIRRVPGATLLFEADGTLDGTKTSIKLVPLRDVRDEQYVVYFMTAGTKPPQPPVVYCPHSEDAQNSAHDEHGHRHDAVEAERGRVRPPSAPTEVATAPALRSRGVEWRVDAQSGRVWARVEASAEASFEEDA
jgi:DUF1680 family protein